MSNGIVRREDWASLREQAATLVRSGFLPRAINTPEKALAVMMTGRELGIGAMQALRSIHVIEGKPTLSAELIAGLVHRRVPGALLRVVESTAERCTVDAARPGQEPTRITWTLDDAKRAGLTGKGNWRSYPRAMLRARALTEAARAVFPDATAGLYDPDEIGAETAEDGTIVSLPSDVVETVAEPVPAAFVEATEAAKENDAMAERARELHDLISESADEGMLDRMGRLISGEHEAGRIDDALMAGLAKHRHAKRAKLRREGGATDGAA